MNIEDIKLQLEDIQHILDTMIEDEFKLFKEEDEGEEEEDLVRINTGWEWNPLSNIEEEEDDCYLYNVDRNWKQVCICNGLMDVEDSIRKMVDNDVMTLITQGVYVGTVEDDTGIHVLRRSRFFSIYPEVFSHYTLSLL